MVAHHVSFLEEQVLEAEKSHGTFLNTVCNLFPCVTISSFKNVSIFKILSSRWESDVKYPFCIKCGLTAYLIINFKWCKRTSCSLLL